MPHPKQLMGYSLNDLLIVGPTIQQDLFSVLVRFRKHTYVLAGDIEKMQRQVLVNPDQRHVQQILWRDNPQDELVTYQLNTVTYGTASAAFLAIRCLHEIGYQISKKYPEFSSIILNDFYVDDLLTGANSRQTILNIKTELTNVLGMYCFPLQKFISNIF